MTEQCATNYINIYTRQSENFKKNIEALDTYDFCPYLTHGLSLSNLQANIELSLDTSFYNKFGFFTFQYLSEDEIMIYFTSRYNIHFDEFIDYVLRHIDESYDTAHRTNRSNRWN